MRSGSQAIEEPKQPNFLLKGQLVQEENLSPQVQIIKKLIEENEKWFFTLTNELISSKRYNKRYNRSQAPGPPPFRKSRETLKTLKVQDEKLLLHAAFIIAACERLWSQIEPAPSYAQSLKSKYLGDLAKHKLHPFPFNNPDKKLQSAVCILLGLTNESEITITEPETKPEIKKHLFYQKERPPRLLNPFYPPPLEKIKDDSPPSPSPLERFYNLSENEIDAIEAHNRMRSNKKSP